MRDKYIYVVLVKAMTGLGKVSRTLTNYEYTHISICLELELEDFITFSRRKHYSPFNAGFIHETRDCYAFGDIDKVKVKVFQVPVSKINRNILIDYINKLEADPQYVFNMYSMLTMPILHGLPIYKAHNCMSFVGKILSLSGAVEMKKAYYRYSIKEIDDLLTKYNRGEYYLRKRAKSNKGYMKPVSIGENAKHFVRLNGKLIYRWLCRDNHIL